MTVFDAQRITLGTAVQQHGFIRACLEPNKTQSASWFKQPIKDKTLTVLALVCLWICGRASVSVLSPLCISQSLDPVIKTEPVTQCVSGSERHHQNEGTAHWLKSCWIFCFLFVAKISHIALRLSADYHSAGAVSTFGTDFHFWLQS